jgi:hypothetical protein
MNFHRKAICILVAVCTIASIALNSFPIALVAVASIGLYAWWIKWEPRKLDVTETTMKEINSKLNAIMMRNGMMK